MGKYQRIYDEENQDNRTSCINIGLLLILFLIVLLGYIQNVIIQTTDVEEGTSSDDIEQIQYVFMADSKAGEVPEKYFLDSKVSGNDETGYPSWMSQTNDQLLDKSSSIQLLLGNIGIIAEEMSRKCEPRRHIVFLKKHKCASSTIYDILNRYKKKHKLFAASKPIGSFVGGYPNFFNSSFIAPPQADKYDIIFNHFRWNENEIKKITFDDTVFLTSVREPLSHYKSVFDFFYGTYNKEEKIRNHYCNLACAGAPFLEMLAGAGRPFENFMTCVPDCYDEKLPWSFRAKNFQVFEMGMDNNDDNLKNFQDQLDQMDKTMDVVLITERYAESILLMRKKLCMNLLDLFVPPKKVHSHDEFQFSDKQKDNFYKFQSLDLQMYNYFLDKFDAKIDSEYGKRQMEIDLRRLEVMNMYCSRDENVRECNKAAELTHIKYNGKDDRAYRGDEIVWADLGKAMAAENGACDYGEYNFLIKNEVSKGCRVYQYSSIKGVEAEVQLNDENEESPDDDDDDDN